MNTKLNSTKSTTLFPVKGAAVLTGLNSHSFTSQPTCEVAILRTHILDSVDDLMLKTCTVDIRKVNFGKDIMPFLSTLQFR